MRGPIQLVKDAWKHFMAHKKLFWSIYLIPAVLNFAFVLTFGEEPDFGVMSLETALWTMLATLVLFVVSVLAGIALIRAITMPEETTVKDAFSFAKEKFWSYTWVGILTTLAVTGGFILFVIPGIIFLVWFVFGYLIVLLEDKRGVEALKTSRQYVKGRWFKVFGRLLFLLLVAMTVSFFFVLASEFFVLLPVGISEAIALLANFIIVPLSLTYAYYMYLDVRSAPSVVETPPATEKAPQPEVASASQE